MLKAILSKILVLGGFWLFYPGVSNHYEVSKRKKKKLKNLRFFMVLGNVLKT